MTNSHDLDIHTKRPESIRLLFKEYQRKSVDDIDLDVEILRVGHPKQMRKLRGLRQINYQAGHEISQIFQDFLPTTDHAVHQRVQDETVEDSCTFEVEELPGLMVVPALLPPGVQIDLLNVLLHRELSNPAHKTNIDLHHEISCDASPIPASTSESGPFPSSFFLMDKSRVFHAKDASIHKGMSVQVMLDKKLRWLTLGGQYDWTKRKYPSGEPPAFPRDIRTMLHRLFPSIDPQAAIVNFYSPGDTLSVHRDVSEECDRGLISISLGCIAIFVVGSQDGSQTAAIRLRSGDALLMTGPSRFAWHGVPKVLPNTCPEELQDWPATGQQSAYEQWRGWMTNKRVNFNVRQMVENLKHNNTPPDVPEPKGAGASCGNPSTPLR